MKLNNNNKIHKFNNNKIHKFNNNKIHKYNKQSKSIKQKKK